MLFASDRPQRGPVVVPRVAAATLGKLIRVFLSSTPSLCSPLDRLDTGKSRLLEYAVF